MRVSQEEASIAESSGGSEWYQTPWILSLTACKCQQQYQ